MELSLGGLLYTGIPFSGWYADVEIVRNLSDESRYNMLPTIAEKLGYSIDDNATLWRDMALGVLNQVHGICGFEPVNLLKWNGGSACARTRLAVKGVAPCSVVVPVCYSVLGLFFMPCGTFGVKNGFRQCPSLV